MLRVGLVGSGPWAARVHAPMLAAGPETHLEALWGRNTVDAARLAAAHGAHLCATFEDLISRVDCVAFAVPPLVQATLAPVAAAAGCHLLLEKPLGATLAEARSVAAAVRDANVTSIMMLTHRFSTPIRDLLRRARGPVDHVQVEHLSDAFLTGPFAKSAWRHDGGVVLDVGPHVFDLLLVLQGPVAEVATVAKGRLVEVTLKHDSGGTSRAVLSAHAARPHRRQITVSGPDFSDAQALNPALEDVAANLRVDLVRTIQSGDPHPCDADRGLEVQQLVDRVRRSLLEA